MSGDATRKAILSRRAQFITAALAGVGLLSGGCSDDARTNQGDGGAGATSGTGTTTTSTPQTCLSPTTSSSTSSTTEVCTDEVNTADWVALVLLDEDMPAAEGGVIPEGKYHLVGLALYTGAGGNTGPSGDEVRASLILTGGEVSYLVDGQDDQVGNWHYDDPNAVAFDFTCPWVGTWPFEYTATPDTLTLFTVPYAFLFALQP